MNPKNIIRATVAVFLIFQVGCKNNADKKNETDVTIENFKNITSYDELSILDDTLLKNKIREMDVSDDESYDQEDPQEIISGKDKILIAGDSWAVFPCLYGSMPKMLEEEKANIINDGRCLRTSKLGIEASEWIGSKQDKRTIKYLKNNSNIKYLYLSLGGNDMMGNWTKDFTSKEENALFATTFKTLQTIMNNYLAVSPNLKIILSGYDFPHFKKNNPIGLYKKIYERMHEPSVYRLNTTLVNYSKYMMKLANYKNIFAIHHLGMAQYYDGVPELNYPARLTLSPDKISTFKNPEAYGGDVNFPCSEQSLIHWLFLEYDAFHLNHENYRKLLKHTYENVLVNIIP